MLCSCSSTGTDFDKFVNNFGLAVGNNYANQRPFDKTAKSQVTGHLICSLAWEEFDEEPDAAVLWYPNLKLFNDWIGIDMVPKRSFEYLAQPLMIAPFRTTLFKKWMLGRNGPPHQTETIKTGDCSAPQEDGGAWIIKRVGPFYSNGNYDWWSADFRDGLRLSRIIKKYPGGVYITTQFIGLVSDSGPILGNPPIHIHHFHMSQQPGCYLKASKDELFTFPTVFEIHGDHQCLPEDGGDDCFFETPALEHVKEVDRAVDLTGTVNDVRASDSETIKWWIQSSLRWHPKSMCEAEPLSQTLFGLRAPNLDGQPSTVWSKNADPWFSTNRSTANDPYGILGKGPQLPHNEIGPVTLQMHMFSAQYYNTTEHTICWGTRQCLHGGEMIRNKYHGHNLMFEKGFFFRAKPQELGLVNGTHPFPFHNAYEYTLLADTGFENFNELQQYLTNNLAEAARNYDNKCSPFSAVPKTCLFNKPFMVCKAISQHAILYDEQLKIDFVYDRKDKICCNPWTFKMMETWTSIAFNGPITKPVSPGTPFIPKYFPQHLNWIMTYKFQNPKIDGKAAFRNLHSYYTLIAFSPQGSSFDEYRYGDIWDYMLRLPLSFRPDSLKQMSTTMCYLISVMHWKDALYDTPNDIPSMLQRGVYPGCFDVGQPSFQRGDMVDHSTVSNHI